MPQDPQLFNELRCHVAPFVRFLHLGSALPGPVKEYPYTKKQYR